MESHGGGMIKNDSRARTPDSSSCIICFRKLGICLVYVMPPTFLSILACLRRFTFTERQITWAFPCTRHSFTEHQHAKGSFTEHQHANSQTVKCGSLHTSQLAHATKRHTEHRTPRTHAHGHVGGSLHTSHTSHSLHSHAKSLKSALNHRTFFLPFSHATSEKTRIPSSRQITALCIIIGVRVRH